MRAFAFPYGTQPCIIATRWMPPERSVDHDTAAIRTLRDVFGFTAAEASIAQALQAGTSLGEYARTHALSLNTIYTHLRRIKEKAGCHRMAELVRKLGDLQMPLRGD